MEKLERIEKILEEMDNGDIVEIWNEFCGLNYYENHIYYMSEIYEFVNDMRPGDVLDTFCDSEFSLHHDWFWFDGRDNPVSSDDPFEMVEVYDLARYICSHEADFGNPDIAEILEEESEES